MARNGEILTPADREFLSEAAKDREISPKEAAEVRALIEKLNPEEIQELDADIQSALRGIILEIHPEARISIQSSWRPEEAPEARAQTNFDHNEDYIARKELQTLARDAIRDAKDIQGNPHLFRFQTYYNAVHNGTANDIKVDGLKGPESRRAITSHIRVTQAFLFEAEAKAESGLGLAITGEMNADTAKAIKEYFGIEVDYVAPAAPEARDTSPEVAPTIRQKLAKEIIGDPVTETKIKEYQKNHNLSESGELSKETYYEMLAEKLVNDFDANEIPEDAQQEILLVLEHGKRTGIKNIALRGALDRFEENHKDDNDFQAKYGDFFKKIEALDESFKDSPEAEEAERVVRENSDSLYKMAKEGRWKEIATNPTLLVAGGILFLFGVIGGDTKFTNTFFKRLGWLLGGLVLGPKLWNELGGGEIIDDVTAFTRSPEAQNAFDTGKTAFNDFFKTTLPEFFAESKDEITQAYESFTADSEARNETYKGGSRYIENITEKGSTLMPDDTFLNASKQQILEAQKTGSLTGIVSDETLQKLNALEMTADDVKNYLSLYVLPNFKEGHEFLRDTFLPNRVTDTAQEALLNLNGTFIDNSKLNNVIKDDINDLRLVGSEAQKRAATKLAIAIQSLDTEAFDGTISGFNLDEFPALTDAEKTKFEALIEKTIAIFSIESYIQSGVQKVNEISPVSGQETELTITTRIQELEDIRLNFGVDQNLIAKHGMNLGDFSTEDFTNAYETKQGELFTIATALGVSKVPLPNGSEINIGAEVRFNEIMENQEREQAELNALIESLGEVPSTTASPVEFRKYYEAHNGTFTKLEEVVNTHASAAADTFEAGLKQAAEIALENRTTLKDNYTESRAAYVGKITTLNTRISHIPTQNIDTQSYETAKKELHSISEAFQKISSEVVEGITIRDTVEVFKAYINGDIIFPAEKNAITYLDDIYGINNAAAIDLITTPSNIKDTVISLESAFEINVDLSQLDINNTAALAATIDELKNLKAVVDSFENESIKEGKYRIIAEAFEKMQQSFLDAINATDSRVEAEQVISRYRTYLAPNMSQSFWDSAWAYTIGIFREEDPVEKAYEAFEVQSQKDVYLELELGNPRIAEIEEIYMPFLRDNSNIEKINDFNARMGNAIAGGQSIKLRVIYNKLQQWENDQTIPEEKRDEITTILSNIDAKITN